MMSTATDVSIAYRWAGSGPNTSHTAKTVAAVSTTAGTKYADTTSASR